MEKKTGHLVMKNAKSVKSFNAMNNRTWERIEKSRRYRCAAAKDIYMTMTEKIDNEVLDGIFLNLGSARSQSHPMCKTEFCTALWRSVWHRRVTGKTDVQETLNGNTSLFQAQATASPT